VAWWSAFTFHNEENRFCVLRVKARGQRDLITVLGHAAMISAGEFVQARPQALEA
jgi:exodeoxyribonuclease V alpha subunit